MRSLERLFLLIVSCAPIGCGAEAPTKAPQGEISDVAVVVKGSTEPLPFDPRGGRITVVTREIKRLVGHPIQLEIDVALSPELKASLEETVLASFETIARELVLLQKEDPAMFAKARSIERVSLAYDAVGKAAPHGERESQGALRDSGKVLAVRAPADHSPLLERGILTQAVYDAYVGDLEARWGEADPTKLAPREQASYFAYMMTTRPGSGFLWIAARREKPRPSKPGHSDDLRVEHLARIVKLANVVEPGTPLAHKVRRFLLESATFLGGFHADASTAATTKAYVSWLNQNVPSFDDDERLLLHRAVFEHRQRICGRDCSPDAALPGFDRFAFGLSVYDAWVNDGAKTELSPGPRGELYKGVVCPSKRRGEAETEIRWGCSPFFELMLGDEAHRTRLALTISERRDTKLLESALLNVGRDGTHALSLVEDLKDETLFRHGASVLFHDLARRDDVKAALERAAPRWWKEAPSRRGFAVLVIARQWEGLHVHYGDNQWTRFVAEFGGPIPRDVFASYLAEGPRAVEMAPKIWPALPKGQDRDALVAKSLPVLLERDREARSSRTGPALVLLRKRLCDEKNASGLAEVRSSIERWSKDHPGEGASVSNALADFTLARCAVSPKPTERD